MSNKIILLLFFVSCTIHACDSKGHKQTCKNKEPVMKYQKIETFSDLVDFFNRKKYKKGSYAVHAGPSSPGDCVCDDYFFRRKCPTFIRENKSLHFYARYMNQMAYEPLTPLQSSQSLEWGIYQKIPDDKKDFLKCRGRAISAPEKSMLKKIKKREKASGKKAMSLSLISFCGSKEKGNLFRKECKKLRDSISDLGKTIGQLAKDPCISKYRADEKKKKKSVEKEKKQKKKINLATILHEKYFL